MITLKRNPYFKSLADAHHIVCDLCRENWNFSWYYWVDFWPFNRQWDAYKKLHKVGKYLYNEFKKESWFGK